MVRQVQIHSLNLMQNENLNSKPSLLKRFGGRWFKLIVFLAVTILLWPSLSSEDRAAIENRYSLWQTSLSQRQFVSAYEIMLPSYRTQTSLNEFAAEFKDYGDEMYRLQKGFSLSAGGWHTFANLYPSKSEALEIWNGPEFKWQKVKGLWYLTGWVDHYLD